VYNYLPNKELRSVNSLDVSQDVIKNQHKNKAKTKPNCNGRSQKTENRRQNKEMFISVYPIK